MSKHWIEQRLQEIGKRKADLADALEIDRSRVSEVLGGRRRIAVSEVPKVSRFLMVPVAEVVRQETGDIGYIPASRHGPESRHEPEARHGTGTALSAKSRDSDNSVERVFQVTRDTLIAFNREGFEEMSAREIDIYAKVIARCALLSEKRNSRADGLTADQS